MMPPTLNIKDPVISLLWFTGTWSCACLFLLIHVRTLLSGRCWLLEQAQYQQGFMSPLPGACFPELWVLSPGWLWLFTQVQQDIYRQLISGMEFPLHLESQGDLWKDSWNARLYRWEELIAQSLQSKSEKKKKALRWSIVISLQSTSVLLQWNPLLWYHKFPLEEAVLGDFGSRKRLLREAKTELLAHHLILMKCQVHKLLYRNSPTVNFFYDDLETRSTTLKARA